VHSIGAQEALTSFLCSGLIPYKTDKPFSARKYTGNASGLLGPKVPRCSCVSYRYSARYENFILVTGESHAATRSSCDRFAVASFLSA
jgi:hypothetical protein